jgi:hypothetical protein
VPGVIVHIHLHQHVAWKKFTIALAFLTVAHLHHFLGGHENLTEPIIQPFPTDPLQQRTSDVLLETRVGLYHIPAHRHAVVLASR